MRQAGGLSIGRAYAALMTIVLIVAGFWQLTVPPFEGLDEGYFYQLAGDYAAGKPIDSAPLFYALASPAFRLVGRERAPFAPTYNPSFRFVSNRHGEINKFIHGPAQGMTRLQLRGLNAGRAVSLLLYLGTVSAIFFTALIFFGRADLALLTAAVCFLLPQFTFLASTMHPESGSTLIGALGYLLIVARAMKRLWRGWAWAGALVLIAVAPLADRQAYFLAGVIPIALLVVDRKAWEWAAAIAGVALAVVLVVRFQLLTLVGNDLEVWLAPLRGHTNGLWSRGDTIPYLLFEFAPKLFFSFIGWLGQPSILLPPWLYGLSAVLILAGAVGLLLPPRWTVTARLSPEQRRVLALMVVGIVVMLAPIVYTNVAITRNSWYGRWLFPGIGPLAILWLTGWRRLSAALNQVPRSVAIVFGAVAVLAATLWFMPSSRAWAVATATANHYGDIDHLLSTLRWTLAACVAWPVFMVLAGPGRASLPPGALTRGGLAAAVACNLTLLSVIVFPLYRPLDPAAIRSQVDLELTRGEWERAGRLYAIALNTYPEAQTLRGLGFEHPLLLMMGGDPIAVGRLATQLARGATITRHEDLMALARMIRVYGWTQPDVLERALQVATGRPELAEGLTLARLMLHPADARDPASSLALIRAAGGVVVGQPIGVQAMLEGYTVHELADGSRDLVVYFRPSDDWSADPGARRLWLHAYAEGAESYIDLNPSVPPFPGWSIGELGWETFRVPAGRFDVWGGVEFSTLGPGVRLGWVGR